MAKGYILALDQGTTGTTAAVIDGRGRWLGAVNTDFPQIFPQSGWVEHNPEDIWKSVEDSIRQVLSLTQIDPKAIQCIGITNQRETIVAWDKKTGKAVHNAIVWQCRRTSEMCARLKKQGYEKSIKAKTGLVLDPYFSGTKIAWLIKNVSDAKSLLREKRLLVGTIDTYLLWKLTGGKNHLTEVSNASRTMLMNLKTLDWDPELLKLFGIPRTVLPEIQQSAGVFGLCSSNNFLPDGIPISGMAGDQQAALFGQACFSPGAVKCTFGTGSFILMNTGKKLVFSKHGMLTTVAWKINDQVTYALEGGAFVCGAAVQWLRDGLKIISSSQEVEALAARVKTTEGVEFIPALTGLGAPYWIPEARGILQGLSRGTTREHIARATLEAMALQNVDIIEAMEKDLGKKLISLNVDGGATENNLLMQLQANYLSKTVVRPRIRETTAYGAALLAGLGAGLWKSLEDVKDLWSSEKQFSPNLTSKDRLVRLRSWRSAVSRLIEPTGKNGGKNQKRRTQKSIN